MVGFRRCITALAVLALFAGLASAQVQGQSPLTCSTNVSVTPSLRVEGLTEQTGDITITCSGGAAVLPGQQIPQVNISLQLNAFVTSRLLPISGGSANASEALLLIDEPGSGLGGYGPSLPQMVCQTPTTGCVQYVGNQGAPPGPVAPFSGGTFGTAVSGCNVFNGSGVCTTTNTTPGANVQQGIVTPGSNQVTWFGIPVLPPVTSQVSRVYRITNIRINATTLGATSSSGATPVIASISISGATSLLLQNPTPTIGFVLKGLDPTTGASGPTSLNQCVTQTRSSVSTLSFVEGFGTAFKTRVASQSTTSFSGQSFPLATGQQNIPGQIYNSESNFILGGMAGNAGFAGLADFGTRLKATFTGIPLGIPSIFVSTTNVFNNGSPVPAPANPGGSAANTGTTGYAVLVSSETASDGNAGAGFFPSTTSSLFGPGGSGNVPVAEIPVVNGTATAVWEVLNTNPNAQETLKFAVYESFTAAAAQNLPGQGTGNVTLSFAPTPPAFSASSGGIAQPSTFPVPRFLTPADAKSTGIFNINICRTILLYPFVTNFTGFETGLAVANTSNDSGTGMTTGAQSGKCTFNFYQGATNPPPFPTPDVVQNGTVYANTVTGMIGATGSFTGYVLAVCNFQFAHGFAFISDVGARNFAEGYLAIVIPDPGTGSRTAQPPCQGISGCSTTGEQGGH